MSDQLLNDGEIIPTVKGEFEVTGVSYQETGEGVRTNFSYHLRLKADVDADRQAEIDHQAALAEQTANEAAETPVDEATEVQSDGN